MTLGSEIYSLLRELRVWRQAAKIALQQARELHVEVMRLRRQNTALRNELRVGPRREAA